MSRTTTRVRPAGAAALPAVALLAAALTLTGCQATRDDAPGGSPAGPSSPGSSPPGPSSAAPSAPVSADPADPSTPSAPSPGSTGNAPATAGADVSADLTITVGTTDNRAAQTFTLTCPPDGGNHPDAEAACAVLAREGVDAFAPTPRDVGCTQQWGGPEVATVAGTVNGQRVSARFDRSDGCEISRWDTLAPLFGPDAGLL